MKKKLPTQLIVGLGILLIGGTVVLSEYFLVKWYPTHKAAVAKATLTLTDYKNDDLGFEMKVAAGLNGKIEPFAGGVRILSSRWLSEGPSLTITTQPNPDQSADFTPQQLAIWETDGVQKNLPRYHYEETRINDRDAVLIWQLKNRSMVLTTRIIAPDHILEATCTPGNEDENLYMQACDESVRTIKVAGAASPTAPPPGIVDLTPSASSAKH